MCSFIVLLTIDSGGDGYATAANIKGKQRENTASCQRPLLGNCSCNPFVFTPSRRKELN